MTKHITVIVVNYNSGARLQKCMAALSTQTYNNFDVIIVDNNSNDNSLDITIPDNLDVRIIRLAENVGFAAANNRAAETSKAVWLAFLNPDAYAQVDWLQAFVNGSERHPEVDAFGSLQLNAADPSLIDGAGDVYFAAGISYRGGYNHRVETALEEAECFAPCAAAAFYRKKIFDQLEGFEERFFCYSEDVDLAFRLRLMGGRVIQLSDAVVHHEGSGITGQLGGFAVYHGHRNRLWTYFRNMPFSLLIITLPIQVIMSFLLVFYFALKGSGGPYLKAMWDAVLGLPYAYSDRRRIQASRRASAGHLAKAMVWSPIRFLKRQPHFGAWTHR